MNQNPNLTDQSGQTMIEVIIALFILTMSLVAGLSLAIYSNSRNVNNRNLIIASNLAREGIETVRLLRDSNWLVANYAGSANDFDSCDFGGGVFHDCYPDTFSEPHEINGHGGGADNRYRIVFDPTPNNNMANLSVDTRNGQENFLLCLQADGSYQHVGCSLTASQFARKVAINTGQTTPPFTTSINNPNKNNGHSPEKIVISTVIWTGKGCPSFDENTIPDDFTTPCKTVVTERLTNWRDYR